MKLLRILFLSGLIIACSPANAQVGNIVGDWQLVKQSRCLEQSADNGASKAGSFQPQSNSEGAASGMVSFKTNSSGEESTRIFSAGKTPNPKKFFYKFNGEMLLILDKKTQTISDSFMVDKFTADSLIISNASRPCETLIFVKINQQTPN